jgi:LmbE family N-acetylglucosaminyl deacetylase
VVFASDSSAGIKDPELAQRVRLRRHEETVQVAQAMRFESVVRLELPDGHLVQHEAPLAERLAEQLRTFQPDLVYCPFPGDGHADHQACALAMAQAAVQVGWKGTFHAYEVWTTLWPNIMVDISEQASEKEQLIRLYASQMEDRDYASGVLGLNRFRGLQHRLDFAEAFYACSAQEFLNLAELLNQLAPSCTTASVAPLPAGATVPKT